jgi:putative endonuclease
VYYVYILKSLKDEKMYVGRSNDLKSRVKNHEQGKVKSTKNRRPLELVFYEAYKSKDDAVRREAYLKSSKGKSSLKMILRDSLK